MAQPYDILMPNFVGIYQQNVERRRQETERRQQEIRNELVNRAYRDAYNPATGRVDTNALMGTLATGGMGAAIPEVTKTFQDLEQSRIANFSAELENQVNLLKGISDNDQVGFEAWRRNAINRLGPEVAEFIPEQITPEVRRNLILKGTEQYQQGYITANTGDRLRVLATQTYAPGKATEVYNAPINVSEADLLRTRSGAGSGAGYNPNVRTVIDPNDPNQTLLVDAKVYQPGNTLGDEGVIGIATTATLPAKDIAKREATFAKNRGSIESFTAKTDNLIRSLERLRSHPGLDRIIGPIQARTPTLSKEAGSAEALLKNILAQGQFRELQEMRANSPTGGALGNVSNFEVKALQDAFAALDPIQDEQSFRNAIDLVIQQLRDSSGIVQRAFDETYSYRNEQGAAGAASSVDDLLEKYK